MKIRITTDNKSFDKEWDEKPTVGSLFMYENVTYEIVKELPPIYEYNRKLEIHVEINRFYAKEYI